jgi:cation transport ATPase
MTGESLPSDKVAGTKAIGGTVNLNDYLKIETEKSVQDSFSRIIGIVKDAQKAAKIQRIADKSLLSLPCYRYCVEHFSFGIIQSGKH